MLTTLSTTWLQRPETSRRVLQRVRVVLDWCKAQGFCSGDNPTRGLTKVLPKHRDAQACQAAPPYEDVPVFVQALRELDAGEVVKLAFKVTIPCATRTSETLGATWEEVKLHTKTWTIPGARMKASVEHRVLLAERGVEILKQEKRLADGGPYVFPGGSVGALLSTMGFFIALRRMKRADLPSHGFRSSFRDWAAERTNAPRAVCEAALTHMLRDKTEAAYNRTDLFERRRDLMESWSHFATAKPAKVLSIRA